MKRIISFLLSLIFIFSTLPLSTLKISASPFMGGDGSAATPYLVGTPEALNAVRDYPDSHFMQVADIDMSVWGNWIPIPNFRGVYDGREFNISYLNINVNDNSTYATLYGLFASASDGTIKNIILKSIDYTITKTTTSAYVHGGADYTVYVGGICGTYGSIKNCSVSGSITVKAPSAFVGGICGISISEITGCFNSAELTVNSDESAACGGICGSNSDKITLSTNAGTIYATPNKLMNVGGICGHNEDGRIQNCVNTGNLICVSENYYNGICYAGGIVGSRGSVKQSVNYGNITAIGIASKSDDNKYSSWTVGGIIGYCSEQYESGAKCCINLARNITSAYNKNDILIYIPTASRINGSVTLGGIGNYTPNFNDCYSLDETLINEKIITPPTEEGMELKEQGKNISADQSLNEASYPEFDFTSTWIIDKTIGGAILRDIPYTPIPISPPTPQEIIADFNEILYRAEHLTSGHMSVLSDLAMHNWLLTNNYSPSKIIIDSHPENMHTVAAAWEAMQAAIEAAEEGFAVAYKHNLKQQDIITAYILAAVGVTTEVKYADAVKENFKHVNNLVKYSAELNNTFVAAGGDFRDFAKGQKGTLQKLLTEYYDKNDPTMSALLKTEKGLKLIGSIIDKANDFEDLYNKLSSYSKLYALNDSTKEALKLMYEVCPDEAAAIKKSLEQCAEIVNSANEEMITDIIEREVAVALTEDACYALSEKFMDYFTKPFLDINPLAEAFIKYAKSQMTAVDKMLGIDARTEQYFKMCAFTELDKIVGLTVQQAIINYKDDRTTKNAATLLAAIELKFGFIDQDFKEAIKYSEIIFDAGIMTKIRNSLLEVYGLDLVNTLKDTLIDTEKTKNALYCTIETSWLLPLESEQPDIASQYMEYRNRIYSAYAPELAEVFVRVNQIDQFVSVHCPVNVSVYNSAGELVAEVGEDMVWSSGTIAVVYDHGEKDIYFFDNSEYRIVCEGYDAGDMDISITNYDSDGNITQTVNYNNVPVASGSIHTLSEEQVTDGSGALLEVDFDSTAGAEKHKITISYGVIEGYLTEHEVAKGERVEISAIIPEGYRFVGWVGEVEFEDAKASSTYFFMPDSDITVSAKLKKIENDDGEDGENDSSVIRVIIIICACVAGVVILGGTAILIITIKKRKIIVSKEKQQ